MPFVGCFACRTTNRPLLLFILTSTLLLCAYLSCCCVSCLLIEGDDQKEVGVKVKGMASSTFLFRAIQMVDDHVLENDARNR